MNRTDIAPCHQPVPGSAGPAACAEFTKRVQTVLAHGQSTAGQTERRSESRRAFPFPIRLFRLDNEGQPVGDGFEVMGKDLSQHGLGFYHTEPITERRMLAVFDCGSTQVRLLVELTWCRFGSHGLFENGGRFVARLPKPTPPQLASEIDRVR